MQHNIISFDLMSSEYGLENQEDFECHMLNLNWLNLQKLKTIHINNGLDQIKFLLK